MIELKIDTEQNLEESTQEPLKGVITSVIVTPIHGTESQLNGSAITISNWRSLRLPTRGAASKGKFAGLAHSVDDFLKDRKETGAL